jgi:membrane protein implicated in regulation of membrane protease activity
MSKYILLAGFPVETTELAVTILIILAVLVIIALEFFRRRRVSKSKSSNLE